MKLYYTPTSPFVRKVLVVARELGLEGRIETTFLRPTPVKADPELSAVNPLNKIPALVLDDGGVLYDSSVIVEYLTTLSPDGASVLPSTGPARWSERRLEALCDGILEAAIQVFYERHNRPEALWYQPWLDGQSEKVRQGLDALEREADSLGEGLGAICAAVTFAWLEFRKPVGDVREGRRALAAFYDRFAARPSMAATVPVA